MTPEAAVASFVAALFSMVNPIGNTGIFAGMTKGRSIAESRQTARSCAVAVAITLLVVTRVMGLILSVIAMGMLAEGLKALLPGLA